MWGWYNTVSMYACWAGWVLVVYWIWFGGTNLVSCFGFVPVWWCGFWVVLGECVVGCYSGFGGVVVWSWFGGGSWLRLSRLGS